MIYESRLPSLLQTYQEQRSHAQHGKRKSEECTIIRLGYKISFMTSSDNQILKNLIFVIALYHTRPGVRIRKHAGIVCMYVAYLLVFL